MGLTLVRWAGTIASVIGSFLVSFGILLPGYSCFMVGAVSWFVVGACNRDRALISLNLFFLTANVIGLWNTLHR